MSKKAWSGLTVGLIPDGNRRWSQKYATSVDFAYRTASKKTMLAAEYFSKQGLSNLIIYGASQANVKSRPRQSFDILIDAFTETYQEYLKSQRDLEINFSFFGDLRCLDENQLSKTQALSAGGAMPGRMNCIFVINYSYEWDILSATQAIGETALGGTQLLDALPSARMPEIDCSIRTAGEHRLSNFLMQKHAYAELIFLEPNRKLC
ncbi:MAG: undecaprenyl diphosphate synthase family protein [Hoeflea sp.]|nr:undecaprenyl diphosphate synthase family protein [Hoeflea sp.]